jgi:hypothetical protein
MEKMNNSNSQNLADAIHAAYAAEQQNLKPAVHRNEIPLSYELITPEWLTEVVCAKTSGAKIASFRLDVADEGNTNRRRIFLTYDQAGKVVELPQSIFCKATHGLANRLIVAGSGQIYGESIFYNTVQPLLDIETPTCYLATYDPHSFNSIVVLEDLAERGGEFCNYTTSISQSRAESQLDLLANLHGKFYGRFHSTPALKGFRNFADEFKRANDAFNLTELCQRGFVAAEEAIPKRLFQRQAEIWPATLRAVELHRANPSAVTHTDTHLRNWYVLPGDTMGLSDWQGIAAGDWGRDVAYAMATSLTVENRRAWERDLLHFYLAKLHQYGGPSVNFGDAWASYRKHLFSALAWWTLTLALAPSESSSASSSREHDIHPKDAALELIRRISTAIDDLDGLQAF